MSDPVLTGGTLADPPLGGALADPALGGGLCAPQGMAGPPGADGKEGPPGPIGPAGGNRTYPFAFDGLTTWAVAHGLGRYPSVTVVETSGDTVLAPVTYLDANNLRIDFTFATSGVAYLN